ncbi:MAG: helix-turn-helix domain-containing protein [Candidatus Moraniibacteriota bacterium]
MNLSEQLNQFGLNKNQAETYLALLELGQAGVISLAKKTNIKRTTLYDILVELEKKHLVARTQKNTKKLFIALEPENLEKILEDKKIKLAKLMPALKALVNTTGTKPIIRYYEGLAGIKEVYRDTLNYNGELLAFVAENIFDKLGKDFADEYKAKRKKAHITVRILVPETEELKKELASAEEDLRTFRFVPKEKFPFTMELNLYGNKLALMSFNEELGIIIESNEIAKNLTLLFELAWIGAKPKDDQENYW